MQSYADDKYAVVEVTRSGEGELLEWLELPEVESEVGGKDCEGQSDPDMCGDFSMVKAFLWNHSKMTQKHKVFPSSTSSAAPPMVEVPPFRLPPSLPSPDPELPQPAPQVSQQGLPADYLTTRRGIELGEAFSVTQAGREVHLAAATAASTRNPVTGLIEFDDALGDVWMQNNRNIMRHLGSKTRSDIRFDQCGFSQRGMGNSWDT